jgi:dihydropteroate synthase-like protein
LPNTPFPQLAQTVTALISAGFRVSVDSVDPQELLTGGLAGADYLLSLNADTLWLADEVESVPVLIPSLPGDLDSLLRAMEQLDTSGRRYLADPILDPLLYGFTESIHRYRELRRLRPDSEILMGIGNVTELTDADTGGINAVLAGIATELQISHVLTTSVSPHAKRAVNETDVARRMMHCAREANSLPRDIDSGLISLHDRRPFPYTRQEIEETAAAVRDPSYRIEVSNEGMHLYNRDGLHTHSDPFELFRQLDLDGDTGHAFYLGTEMARAQIAWQLGKRYVQDQELNWGCASEQRWQDDDDYTGPGTTLTRTGKR